MTAIPMRTNVRFMRGYGARYAGYITYSLGAVRAGVPRAGSVLPAATGRSTQRKALRRIRGRVELPTPSYIVGPACGGDSAATPEGDPPRFLVLRHPRPLEAALLSEGHDVAHGGGLYAPRQALAEDRSTA